MNKIVIAYHAYMHGSHYMDMMTEQFRKILTTRLYGACDKIFIGLVDDTQKKPEYGEEWVKRFWSFATSKGETKNDKVEITLFPDNREETRTLMWVRDYAAANPGDYVLYFHTKGITQYTPATESWRKYMEYFSVERWQTCIDLLKSGYDCCGVLWNKETPLGYWPHFSGGMWWATTDYINTLQHDYLEDPWRYKREFWIGSNPNAKVFEHHNSGLNTTEKLEGHRSHYDVVYSEALYRYRFL